jgi:geranylgeranyl pyrophosphate synthase
VEDWSFVIELLQAHGALEECRSRALASAERALEQLEGMRPSVFLEGLRQAVQYAVTRSH